MEEIVLNNLSTYGPWAVFILLMLSGIGIALGEEMVTIPAGVLVATGEMDFWTTAIVAYVAIVLADCLWFFICSRYGTQLLHKRWAKRLVHPRKLLQVKHQFETRGPWIVVMARFIPSSRSSTITVAGMMHMPFWQFLVATAACVLVTVPLQVGLGVLIGRGSSTEDFADLLMRVIGVIMLTLAVTITLSLFMRHRASKKTPRRAKARWLRRFRTPSHARPVTTEVKPANATKPEPVGAGRD